MVHAPSKCSEYVVVTPLPADPPDHVDASSDRCSACVHAFMRQWLAVPPRLQTKCHNFRRNCADDHHQSRHTRTCDRQPPRLKHPRGARTWDRNARHLFLKRVEALGQTCMVSRFVDSNLRTLRDAHGSRLTLAGWGSTACLGVSPTCQMSCRRVLCVPPRSATRIVGRNYGGGCRGHALRHFLVRGAQLRVVVPRHEATGSQSNAVDAENERGWTRATTDRDTLHVLLLRETLGTDHGLLDKKRTERRGHSVNLPTSHVTGQSLRTG